MTNWITHIRSRCQVRALLLIATSLPLLAGCDLFTSADTRIERAEDYMEQGDYRGATIELTKVLRKDAQHARARLLLGQVEYQIGDLQAAERDLERAVEAGARIDDAAPWIARVYLASGRHEQLLVQLKAGELILAEPTRSIVTGRAHLAAGDPIAAAGSFRSALAIDPAATEASLGLAESQVLTGDLEGALVAVRSLTASDPAAAGAWLVAGQLLLQSGRPAEAETAFAAAAEHAAGRLTELELLRALAGRFESRLAQGQLDGAAETLELLTRRSPNSRITLLLSAKLSLARRDLTEAGRILRSLATEVPGEPVVSFLLGTVLLAQGNLNQAEVALAAVVAARPENLEARKLLAEARLRMNRPDDAMAVLTPALQGDVSDPRAEALMAAAQLEAGTDPTALSRLEQSVARNPGDGAARLQLASLYLSVGRADDAAELLRATASPPGDARRDALLIRAVMESRGPAMARAEVDRILREKPDDVEVLNLAARHYLAVNDLDAAAGALDRALAIEPGHVQSLLNLASVRTAAGDLDGAEAPLRRVLLRDSGSVPARIGLAEIASRRGQSAEARKLLEEIRVASSQAIGSRLMLARLYLADKDVAKADAVLKEILAAAPDRADVLAAVGQLELDAGRTEQALARFRKAADLEPRQPEHWLGMARAQVALGYKSAAWESLQKALMLDPTSIRAVGHAVLFELKTGRGEQALKRVLELRRQAPASAAAASLEGDVRTALGQHEAAAGAYRQAAALQPRLYSVVRESQARQRAGVPDPAAPLATWLRDHPDDVDARSIYAVMLDVSGQPDRAVKEYELLLEAGRINAVTANNLAWRYFERGDPRAEGLARQALGLAPDNPAIADTLGWILLQGGEVTEALRLLESAAKRSPDVPEIQLHYAEGLVAAGRAGEAVPVLERLLADGRRFDRRTEAEALLARLRG